METLSQFHIKIEHRPGKEHTNADGLSRRPTIEPGCPNYKSGTNLNLLPCGGCAYCARLQKQWGEFEENVDSVGKLSDPVPQVRRTKQLSRQVPNRLEVSCQGKEFTIRQVHTDGPVNLIIIII